MALNSRLSGTDELPLKNDLPHPEACTSVQFSLELIFTHFVQSHRLCLLCAYLCGTEGLVRVGVAEQEGDERAAEIFGREGHARLPLEHGLDDLGPARRAERLGVVDGAG